MLVTPRKLLIKARQGKWAVGAFNISDLEFAQAVIEAAKELKAPVIVQTSEKAIKYAGLKELACLVKTLAEKVKALVVLHLDHGQDINLIKKAIKAGYTSVMFDGSRLPFKKNIDLTKKIVKLAHSRKISVEGEVGAIAGSKENNININNKIKHRKKFYTDPEEAVEFVKKTGIDSLAVAVGTAHGPAKAVKGFKEKINFSLLKEISKKIKIPLVLHGASQGIPNRDIKRAIKLGIAKINIDTDLRLAFSRAERNFLKKNKKAYDPREIIGAGREAVKAKVKEKIKLFNK